MASASHEELIAAPFAVVWALLEAKVYHPERSVPGVRDVRILHDGGAAGVERMMFLPQRGADVHELITWTRTDAHGVVTFKMLSDAQLEGAVLNEATAEGAGATRVKYTMDWKFRDGVPLIERRVPFTDGGAGAIKGAVLGMKAAAEAVATA
jgi:hypothetical protein